MQFKSILGLALAATTAVASPARLIEHSRFKTPSLEQELQSRELMEFARSLPHEKRISEDFPLDHEFKDETLFNGNLVSSADGTSKSVNLNVKCVDCSTKGTITAKLTTEKLIKPVIRFEFHDVTAKADLDVKTTGTLAFTLNLFTSETPLGLSLPGVKIGLIFSVDLVFAISDPIDLEGGFTMSLPNDAFFEMDVFDGDISDKLFDGSGFEVIPVTVHNGGVTFKADLRLRVDLAASADFKIGGGGVSAGVFANLVEFVAKMEETDDCGLQAEEFFDLNVGATASAGIGAGPKTFNIVPGVSTTLLNSPTSTQCLIEKNAPATTTEAAAPPPPPPTDTTSAVEVTETSTLPPYVTGSYPLPGNGTTTTLPPINNNGTALAKVYGRAPTAIVKARQDAPKEYVITTCAAADVINCPIEMASIITVTQTAEAQIAAITPGPSPNGLRINALDNYMVLSEMATPIINSYVMPTKTA